MIQADTSKPLITVGGAVHGLRIAFDLTFVKSIKQWQTTRSGDAIPKLNWRNKIKSPWN